MSGESGPSFGVLLRRYRKAAGLTQEQLAERAYLSPFTVSALERGANHRPRPDTVDLLAQALGLADEERAAFTGARHGHQFAVPERNQQAFTSAARPVVPLVGRTRELKLLERHLRRDGPPVLLLAGEPGIGKSRLLAEATRRADESGWHVLEGGCQRRGGQEPYAPLLEALHHSMQRQGHDQQCTSLRGCAWLVRLLPELAAGPIEPLPPWTLSPEQERRLMFEAVGRFVRNVAGSAGTLLLLDDLQWAGSDGLDLLAALVRATVDIPLCVIGAYRDTEVQPHDPLSVLLADLAQAGLATQRTLAPLERAETALLLDLLLEGMEDVDGALRDQAVQRSGGVPFFAVSCAHELRTGDRDGGEERGPHVRSEIPWSVARSVRQRMAPLSVGVREVLELAAVVGRIAERAVLVAVSARPRDEVLEALDTACAARLLETEGRDTYRFAHDIVREVVESDVGAGRRAALHERVAAVLEARRGAPPLELLAYHYGRSGEQDKAVQYLEQAADHAAAQRAYAAAEAHYRDALERLDAAGRTLDAAGIREKLGTVLISMAHYAAALPVLEQAAEQHHAGANLEEWGRIVARIGWAYAQQGTSEMSELGVARLQPVVAALEAGGPSPSLAALYIALARLAVVGGRIDDVRTASGHAVEVARPLGDDHLLAQALGRYGHALLLTGQVPEGLRALEEAGGLAESVGDLWTLGRTLINAAGCGHDVRGDFALSRRCIDRALELAERDGDPAQLASAISTRGMNAFFMGDWSQARHDLERAVALCRQFGASWVLRETLRDLGEVVLHMGAWDEAQTYLEEAQSLDSLAECLLLQGQPAAARARITPYLDDLCPEYINGPIVLTRLAWIHLELGEVAEASAIVARAISGARSGENRLALVDALRVQALVSTHQERWSEAVGALEEGIVLARRMPYPYAEARLLHVYGTLHTRKSELVLARERLQEALAIFRRLGARKDAERAEQDISHP